MGRPRLQRVIYNDHETYYTYDDGTYYYYDDGSKQLNCEPTCSVRSQRVKYSVNGKVFEYFFEDLWNMRDIECPDGSHHEGRGKTGIKKRAH